MKSVRVYRNPDCPACARYARMHQRLDWLDRVEVSTRTPANHPPLRIGEVIVEDLHGGRLLEGADAFELLARHVPAYWFLLPLLHIPFVRGRVDREMRGACDDTCEIPR